MADATYVEPVDWQTVARIIEKEKPSALLPTMGGQTALNCALDLVREVVLQLPLPVHVRGRAVQSPAER